MSEYTPISPELDLLACDLMETAFEALAAGMDISVLVSWEDSHNNREMNIFNEDSKVACLEGAREFIKSLPNEIYKDKPQLYVIAYLGSVACDDVYEDALIIEYGEAGQETGFSGYSFVSGIGEGEQFMWSEPAAAGVCELLV